MQIRRSVVFLGLIRQFDVKVFQIRIRVTLYFFVALIIKITIYSIVIGLKLKSYFPLIHLSSCYRSVCYRTACYRTACYRTVCYRTVQ